LQLASFQDLLRTQTEVVLCERLNHDFIKLTAEVKETKRRLDKRSSEYDAARLKHLGHRQAGVGERRRREQAGIIACCDVRAVCACCVHRVVKLSLRPASGTMPAACRSSSWVRA
jgi:hypothetical protein